MSHIDLELTYRDGRPPLGYLYLSEDPNEKSEHSRRVEPVMVIDSIKTASSSASSSWLRAW